MESEVPDASLDAGFAPSEAAVPLDCSERRDRSFAAPSSSHCNNVGEQQVEIPQMMRINITVTVAGAANARALLSSHNQSQVG